MIRAEIYNYKQKQLDHCDKAKRVKIERERERAIGVRVEEKLNNRRTSLVTIKTFTIEPNTFTNLTLIHSHIHSS